MNLDYLLIKNESTYEHGFVIWFHLWWRNESTVLTMVGVDVSQSNFSDWRIHVQTFAWFSLSIGKTRMIVWLYQILPYQGLFSIWLSWNGPANHLLPQSTSLSFHFLSNKDGVECYWYRKCLRLSSLLATSTRAHKEGQCCNGLGFFFI